MAPTDCYRLQRPAQHSLRQRCLTRAAVRCVLVQVHQGAGGYRVCGPVLRLGCHAPRVVSTPHLTHSHPLGLVLRAVVRRAAQPTRNPVDQSRLFRAPSSTQFTALSSETVSVLGVGPSWMRPLSTFSCVFFCVCARVAVWLQRLEGQALLAAQRVHHAPPAQVARPRTGLRHRHQGETTNHTKNNNI